MSEGSLTKSILDGGGGVGRPQTTHEKGQGFALPGQQMQFD